VDDEEERNQADECILILWTIANPAYQSDVPASFLESLLPYQEENKA